MNIKDIKVGNRYKLSRVDDDGYCEICGFNYGTLFNDEDEVFTVTKLEENYINARGRKITRIHINNVCCCEHRLVPECKDIRLSAKRFLD